VIVAPSSRAIVLGFILLWTPQAATSARTWIGRESQIEQHLKTAAIASMAEIGTGVTRPRRARVTPADPFESLTWKVIPPGVRDGYWESYKSEIAAYQIDKVFALGMVPPAVERTINDETGAAIMWIDGVKSVKESGGRVPSGPAWDKPIRRMRMFDNLICNKDRNAGNILIGSPGELILIDHSRAFLTDRDPPARIERVDGELWDRMTAVPADDLTRALQPWIDSAAIHALLERRKRMMADVDRLVRQRGRARVIIR
jgi:hypothetical protein